MVTRLPDLLIFLVQTTSFQYLKAIIGATVENKTLCCMILIALKMSPNTSTSLPNVIFAFMLPMN